MQKWLLEAVVQTGLNYGPATGFCTMTMLHLTRRS